MWKQQEPGVVNLFSHIIDARVYVDEEFIGYTSGDPTVLFIMKLTPGKHFVRVQLTKCFGMINLPEITFYDWQGMISIQKSTPTRGTHTDWDSTMDAFISAAFKGIGVSGINIHNFTYKTTRYLPSPGGSSSTKSSSAAGETASPKSTSTKGAPSEAAVSSGRRTQH